MDFSADVSEVVTPKRFPFPTTLPVACLPDETAQMLRDRLAPSPIRSTMGHTALAAADLPTTDWPFLGDILEQTSARLVSDRTFTLTDDCFLQDHVFGGALSQFQPDLKALPVIPLTFSLEMMAEAASCLVGASYRVVSLHNLRAYRWISLDTGSVRLRAEAQMQAVENSVESSKQSVYVKLFQLGADAADVLVFEGEIKLQLAYPTAPAPWAFALSDPAQPSLEDADLYRTCMFHGPRLQGVKHLRQWSLNGIEADLEVLSTEHFHRSRGRLRCCLDPGLLDAAGQLLGYWISEQWGPADSYCFPFQIAALYQYTDPLPAGSSVVCRSYIQFTSKHQLEASFDLIDESGRVITRIEGWSDICYQVPRNNFYACRIRPQSEYLSVPWMQVETGTLCRLVAPFPEHFLETSWGIWQRMLAHLMLSQPEREVWYALPERGDRRTDWLLGRIAAKDALRQWADQVLQVALAPVDIEIRTTPAGKPYASCAALPQQAWPDLSISHSEGYAIASVALAGQQLGIDIERRSPVLETMQPAFTKAEIQLLQNLSAEMQALAIQGLWCAKEAAAKAAGIGLQNAPQSWEITQYSPGFDQMIVTYGEASFAVSLWYTGEEVVAVCLR
ncbi:MAG: 4'-phosphopantetheinyl transferase superfamily protein [Phormidesmis sp. RL_2_1]|nr:4'-phosphopantetheinyl transferase superfamily protein [Phormidesmis sp. RL_2_1]